ncbi:hypothetical protein AVEN_6829-1, partial [Araneus ventricosus]
CRFLVDFPGAECLERCVQLKRDYLPSTPSRFSLSCKQRPPNASDMLPAFANRQCYPSGTRPFPVQRIRLIASLHESVAGRHCTNTAPLSPKKKLMNISSIFTIPYFTLLSQ